MKKKKRTTIYISTELDDCINSIGRDKLPNKSELIESLLWEWINASKTDN